MRLEQNSLDGLKVADQKGRITLGSKYAGKRFAIREDADGSTTLIPVLIVPERDHPLTSPRLTEAFASLELLSANWDGHGSLAPSSAMLREAREVLALLHAGALAHDVRWEEPHLGVNERGQITLEWWQGERSLTIFVRSAECLEYLKAWGANIETEMEEGEISHLSDFSALSRWLYAPTEGGTSL